MKTSSRAKLIAARIFVSSWPACTDERRARFVFGRAGRFADAHEVRVADFPRPARDSSRSRRADSACTSPPLRDLVERVQRRSIGPPNSSRLEPPTTMPGGTSSTAIVACVGVADGGGVGGGAATGVVRARRRIGVRRRDGATVSRTVRRGGSGDARAVGARASPAYCAPIRAAPTSAANVSLRSLAACRLRRGAASRRAAPEQRASPHRRSGESRTSSDSPMLAALLEVAAQLLPSVHRAASTTRSRIASATSVFGSSGSVRLSAVARERSSRDSCRRAKPAPGSRRVVQRRSGRVLRVELLRAVRERVVGLEREADDDRARRTRRDRVRARMSGVGSSAMRPARSPS